jgi:GWxTD domain-containing protein
VLLGVPLAPLLAAADLAGLFQKAKAEVKSESWSEALATLDRLDAESARPGHESARRNIEAPIAFYRGVCEANLDMAEKAEADFATFLRERPGSSLDAAMYSKKAVAAFEAARKDVAFEAAREDVGSGSSVSLFRRFQEFKAPPDATERPDERWADGPVKWILTAEERAEWAGLTGEAERAGFVEKFWQGRNPKPGTEDNTARTGFDRRVAFADAYFRLDERQRGSLTDAGMVFVLLGPPSWTGRKPIVTGEDPSESGGMSLDEQMFMGARNSVHIDGARIPDPSGAFREIWHYRREVLPAGVSASQVNVVFITKKGLGRSVLQREPATLAALDAARQGKSKK